MKQAPNIDEQRTRTTRVLEIRLGTEKALVVVALELVGARVLPHEALPPLEVVCVQAGGRLRADHVEVAYERRIRVS